MKSGRRWPEIDLFSSLFPESIRSNRIRAPTMHWLLAMFVLVVIERNVEVDLVEGAEVETQCQY